MGSFQSFLLQGPDIKDNMTLILLSLAQITQPSRRGADGRRREVALWPDLQNFVQKFVDSSGPKGYGSHGAKIVLIHAVSDYKKR